MKALRRLYGYLRPYRGWAILALSSMILVALTQGALVALSRPLFDEVLTRQSPEIAEVSSAKKEFRAIDYLLKRSSPEGQRGPLINLVDSLTGPARQWWTAHEEDRWRYIPVMFLVVFIVRAVTTFFSEYAFQKVGLSTVRDLRNELYESMMNQSHRFFSERSTGELISRIVSDADQIQAAVSIRMGDLFQETATLIVLSSYVVLVNTELAFFTLIVAPVIVYPIIQFGRRLRRTTHKSQERMAGVATLLEETIKGVRIVKAFTMERFEARRFREATQKHLDMNLKAQRIQALTSPVMELLAGICIVLLLLYAGYRIQTGALSQGQFLSFLMALALMYAPVKRLNKVNLAMNSAISAAERVFRMLDVENEVMEKPDAIRISAVGAGIAFEGVSFTYGTEPVLEKIDLSIAPGELVALVGSSGAGKTTLVNLLPRFYDVSDGRITIDGHDVRYLTLASLRGLIGFVTQEVVLFNDDVRNNIAYGRADISEAEVIEAARAANAHDFIMELPEGYDSQIGEGGVLLSGGQRQRLAIARALFKDPPILVLDEATSALDAESERLVQQALANLMRGRTTLVIAHRLSTVRRADKIVVLDKGSIQEIGRHEELLARQGIYRRLYDMQFLEEESPTEALI
ncbi:MAG TPA: ABC transporter transmembrane domain-containing protein [Thermoanaerobaculia bacterium]|nr:ABC transporter transmembrane domain-containing protein [Thermoanaerobaculia bacterium]